MMYSSKGKQKGYWTHFILEGFCLFDLLKKSGAKPKRYYTLVEEKGSFKTVPSKEKVICPPLSQRIDDEKAFCKTPEKPTINKCFKGGKLCPFFAYVPVDKEEYEAMILAWEVYSELKEQNKKMTLKNIIKQLKKTLQKTKIAR